MAPMIRKQVYLDPRHDRMLKRRARQLGVTEAEIIREALDSADSGVGRLIKPRAKLDADAAQKAVAFMQSLTGRRSQRPAGRTWTREGLYDERIRRWTKS